MSLAGELAQPFGQALAGKALEAALGSPPPTSEAAAGVFASSVNAEHLELAKAQAAADAQLRSKYQDYEQRKIDDQKRSSVIGTIVKVALGFGAGWIACTIWGRPKA
jgi:CRISPR/Cas system CSM-associated protein Csm5 (group 7 of RAMP superfamily)